MTQRKLLWSIPALLYLLFCFWYTDLSGRLTGAEVDKYVGILEAEGGAPDRINDIRAFLEADTGRQFIMVNLITMAQSPPPIAGAPENASAQDLLDVYMAHMYPELFKRACHPVFLGDAVHGALDSVGLERPERWGRAALMRYRSRRDMIEIATNPAFRGRHEFKVAAFDRTLAFPVETVLYLSDPRVLLFVLLLAAVAVSDIALHGRRRQR